MVHLELVVVVAVAPLMAAATGPLVAVVAGPLVAVVAAPPFVALTPAFPSLLPPS